jgi:hypothetical protein
MGVLEKELRFIEQPTPPTLPLTGELKVYAKSDDNLYKQNAAGLEVVIGAGPLALSELAPPANVLVTPGYGCVVPNHFECVLGITTEIGAAGILEIT